MGNPTNFPNGVSSYGVPIPPNIPFGIESKVWFCAPHRTGSENGASDGNAGTTPRRAVKTLSKALSLAREDKNDVIFMIASGNSAAETTDDQTESLAWNKDLVHLVGVNAGNMFSQRSRIGTQTTALSPLVNVTANGCHIANVQAFHGVTGDNTGLIAWQDSGERNVYYNTHFAGGGISTTADDAGMRSLKLAGGGERRFINCVIGLDTVDRSTTANAELEFAGSVRDVFDDCVLTTYGSGAHAMVIVTATGLDRYALMRNCAFINPIQSGTTALNEVFSCTAGTSPNGAIILKDPLAYGCGPWEADAETGRVVLLGHPTPASTDGSGLAGAPESP